MENSKPIHTFETHRRTITETDIVNYVNLFGMHEPIFSDMEFVKESMPGTHNTRFAPGPFIISMGIGLVAPMIIPILGKGLMAAKFDFAGGVMAGIKGRMKGAVQPGDTLHVKGELYLNKTTNSGNLLLDLRHLVTNQHKMVVADFTETIMVFPESEGRKQEISENLEYYLKQIRGEK